ncbi:MAG: cyclic pyranopterin monophosphate synthase MoaC [Nanoarchaeota archaeon]|nr:cyclic pyranopterin monophosphate synthase MoaC [Nanoarchaeota archaeon]MBU1321938.1 cyclic pyranopterin monophosphate synthase MoaC [Nanoarchaeota archaeon]MBU1597934.1 cyclic pyranopterin monophosphate synthase MoaC [Nanoarchaeota archaeon]MBU2441142.1 cyclic pyranopterin monophosphate synthase MoaC [Nanoarchaeota archaeon]
MQMIDISDKEVIKRRAVAQGKILLKKETIEKIKNNKIKKGNPLEIAQIVAMNAVKQTPLLIPMCHQIPLEKISTEFKVNKDNIIVRTTVTASAKTGVEMEALIGVSIALNTIWDLVKYLEKDEQGQYPDTRISDIKVVVKEKCALNLNQKAKQKIS